MPDQTYLVLFAAMAVLWLLITPLFLFARRFRVYRPVFATYPAVSRAWWSLLLLLVAIPCMLLLTSVALPTWALWLLGIWTALQALCIPGVLLIRSEIAQAKRGQRPRRPIAPRELFISYNRETAEHARTLWQRLGALGIPVWFGERELLVEGRSELNEKKEKERVGEEEPTQNREDASKKEKTGTLATILRHGLLSSRYCITLVSPRALTSEWVAGFEWPHFEEQEQREGKLLVLPVLVGSDPDQLKAELPAFLQKGRPDLRWEHEHQVDSVLEKILEAVGLGDRFQPQDPPRYAGPKQTHSFDVTTTRAGGSVRIMDVSLDLGPHWQAGTRTQSDMPMALENQRTGMHLNLIVGPMQPQAVAALDEHTPKDVEDQNVHAGRMFLMARFLSFGVRGRKLLASHLINLPWTGGPPPKFKDDRGALVEVKNRQQLAFSYRSFGAYHRKYSVLIRPGPIKDRKHFEFVFTAYMVPGEGVTWRRFLEAIPEVDDIVRSLKVEQRS